MRRGCGSGPLDLGRGSPERKTDKADTVGLVLDTNVLIRVERSAGARCPTLDFSPWDGYGNVYISLVTASELLVGVHRPTTQARRIKRSAFVESVLAPFRFFAMIAQKAKRKLHISVDAGSLGESYR